MQIVKDITALRNKKWSWTRIANHYGVSEREVRRWVVEETSIDSIDGKKATKYPYAPTFYKAPPLALTYKTALIVNDTQYPHYDPAIWEATCEIARDTEIDKVLWNGDMLDFEQLSSFAFNEYKTETAAQDVENFHRDLVEPLDSALNEGVEHVFLEGNHEYRYTRYMEHNAGAIGDCDPVRFMQLEEFDEFVPYGPRLGHFLTPDLVVVHGWRVTQNAPKDHVNDMGCSVLHGHTHRVSSHYQTVYDRVLVGWELGHMADPSKVPGQHGQGQPNWQQVAGTLVYYSAKGDSFSVHPLIVFGKERRRVIAGDKEYRIG